LASRDSANHERPRQDWIEIAVPALVSEETFALAQEQLEQNERHSPRRTIEPTLVQGMLVCERCGYGLYRTCTQTSARRLYYYRCIGSDAYRHLKGAVCDNPPVRQDQLDAVVWKEVMSLLEDPHIVQDELNRRLEAAKNADPLKQREDRLRRDQARLAKGMDRLLTAYQESLVSLEQLRCRMPELRQQDQAIKSELQSLETVAGDQAKYLRLVETLADFHARLQARAETLDVPERQKILRLLVKEVLVGRETITIRHSIRMPNSAPDPSGAPRPPHAPEPPPMTQPDPCYLLRSGRHHRSLRRSYLRFGPLPFFRYPGLQPFLDQPEHPPIRHPQLHQLHQLFMADVVEEAPNVGVEYPVHFLRHNPHRQRVQRVMRSTPRAETIREPEKVLLVNPIENRRHSLLHDLVFQRRDPQWPLPAIRFRDVDPA
jgi:site-specific DNA recombinase